MYKNKRILAIIPARSGSKGLKDKNIKELKGKPMLAYTIETAIESNIFDDIVLSTDSEKYAKIGRDFGAQVPFLRPDNLSTDEATTKDVMVYTLERLRSEGKNYDYFMILQPTSPLRTAENIREAVGLLFEKEALSVVSVCEADHSPLYMNTLDGTLSLNNFMKKDVKTRRQELPTYYRPNGAIYICQVDHYLNNGNLYNKKSYAYIMDKKNSIDVDDEMDFIIAEALLNTKSKEEK